MTDGFIQVAPDSTGQRVRMQQLNNGSGLPVDMQNIVVSDPFNFPAMQTVRAGGSPVSVTDGAAIVAIRPDGGGSAGVNYSANNPAWPNIGSNFGSGSALFPSWVLLASVPANPARANITVDNMSNLEILCLRDDGTAATGSVPSNATGFTLNPKVTAGPEGGHYESPSFRGRLQVFGVSSSQFVSISTD